MPALDFVSKLGSRYVFKSTCDYQTSVSPRWVITLDFSVYGNSLQAQSCLVTQELSSLSHSIDLMKKQTKYKYKQWLEFQLHFSIGTGLHTVCTFVCATANLRSHSQTNKALKSWKWLQGLIARRHLRSVRSWDYEGEEDGPKNCIKSSPFTVHFQNITIA